ncbi:glycerophosphodiester phosphodiesterase [Candidatus Poriferisodalis sp.]|uniref:glycerophosphodiester phosphodiesterase n=1 Tax=Candidatus Poriferisodalis sp. TaxID=3101277 RepID=UPI003B51C6BD
MPPQPLPSLRTPPITFAHRGGRAHGPDNALETFALALDLGATGLETDVWLSRDGHPMLDHDGVVWHRGVRRPFSSFTRERIGPDIGTLADMYQSCGTDFELSVDLKDPAAADAVIEAARSAGAEDRLWLCHADWGLLGELRSRTTAHIVDSTRIRRMKEGPERRAAAMANSGIDAINLPAKDWTGGLAALFHRFERLCFGWDVQHIRLAAALRDMGLDGLYGDHVDRLLAGVTSPSEPVEPAPDGDICEAQPA